MAQEKWIQAVKSGLRGGPLRFTYERLGIMYVLRDTGDELYPRYQLHIEREGRMLSDTSYGSKSLEDVLQDHPLDRFVSERKLELDE